MEGENKRTVPQHTKGHIEEKIVWPDKMNLMKYTRKQKFCKADEFNVHRKVRKVTGKYKRKHVGRCRRANCETWKKYMNSGFFNERKVPLGIL